MRRKSKNKKDRSNIDRLKNMDNLKNTRENQISRRQDKKRPTKKTKQRPSRRPLENKKQRPRKSRVTRKKSRSRSIFARILILASFIIGTVYVIGIVVKTNQKPMISYQTVQRGSIDNSILLKGLVVRDEITIKNKQDGKLRLIAADGDKVKKNGQVYQILTGAESAAIEKDIKKLESDIEKVQSKREDMSYYQNEIQVINNNIGNYVNDFYITAGKGNIEDVQVLKINLEYELDKKKTVHMKDNSDALSGFQEEKQKLTSKLAEGQHIYTSPESGIVSYYTDSKEDLFTVENLKEINEADIKGKYDFIPTNLEQSIKADQPAYKLIKSDKWYVVSFIEKDQANNFEKGSNHDFILIDDQDIEFALTVIDNIEEGDKNRIIFSSRDQIDKFANKRNIEFKSKQHMYEGLKLPVSSIVERNMIKIPSKDIIDSDQGSGVFKTNKSTGESKFINVDIQYTDEDGFSYILQELDANTLAIGDIIENQSAEGDQYEIANVDTIQGVYVVNGRITKFKRIKIEAQNEDYIIANPNTVQGLKPFDQIVTNPKNTKEKQLLRDLNVKNSR